MSLTGQDIAAAFKKQPMPFICGGLAVVLALAAYFRGLDLPDLETKLEESSARGERQKANIKNGAQLPEQLAGLTAINASVGQRLIKASELAKNSQYFYKIEAETGTKLLDLRPLGVLGAKGAAKSAYTPVTYNLSVQGEFAQLLTFLRRLENGPHFCRITTAVWGGGGLQTVADAAVPESLTLNITLEFLGQP